MRYGTKKELPHRDTTRMVNIGGVVIGGGNPIAIQSMTNTETSDVAATVAQILELEKARLSDYPFDSKYRGGSEGVWQDQGTDSHSNRGRHSFRLSSGDTGDGVWCR